MSSRPRNSSRAVTTLLKSEFPGYKECRAHFAEWANADHADQHSEAIVIRPSIFETSLVLTLFTRNSGKFGDREGATTEKFIRFLS